MKKYILTLTTIFSLTLFANNDLSKFIDKKSKQIDSISVIYNLELINAQKNYEDAILKSEKKFSDALKKIEQDELKFLDKIKIDTTKTK